MQDKSIKTHSGYEIRANSGNIFKNNSENPKAPSYKGLVNIDGKGYDLALWKTEKGYLNVKFTEHKISADGTREEYSYDHSSESEQNIKKAQESNNNEKDDFGDDIPF